MTGAKLGDLAIRRDPKAVPTERRLHGFEKFLIVNGFRQEFDSARLHSSHRHRNITVTGDENDGYREMLFGEPSLKLEPAQPGQADVQHDTTRSVRAFA